MSEKTPKNPQEETQEEPYVDVRIFSPKNPDGLTPDHDIIIELCHDCLALNPVSKTARRKASETLKGIQTHFAPFIEQYGAKEITIRLEPESDTSASYEVNLEGVLAFLNSVLPNVNLIRARAGRGVAVPQDDSPVVLDL